MRCLIALPVLLAAVIEDFREYRISNRLIAFGLLCGLVCRYVWEGAAGLIYGLVNISIPVILLYLLFQLRVLGAGDIKLFSVTACYFSLRQIMGLILTALIAAAAAGVCKILYRKCKGTYDWKAKTQIHFSIFILTSYLITIWRCTIA